MSLSEVFQELGESVLPDVLDAVSNGDVRVLAANVDSATDAAGFPDPSYTARTIGRIPCVWEVKSDTRLDVGEQAVAAQVEGFLRYRVSIPKHFAGDAVVVESQDRLELAQAVGSSDYKMLEITGVINESNVVWTVLAIELRA